MEKRISFVLSFLVLTILSIAQVPQKFKYQAVVRNSQHTLLENHDVGFRMSILQESEEGEVVYSESQTVKTNPFGVADLHVGEGEVISGDFSNIDWGSDDYFLKVEADPAGGSSYEYLGTTQLVSVPYALYSGNISSPTRKFTIQEEAGHPVDAALFEVKNADGQTVFGVYPEGTRVYILDENPKGIKGGFAVGGYNRTGKGITKEYMRVTPDSTRLYFNEAPTKGIKGGFAVGGYNRTGKGPIDHYFELKPDSAKFMMISDQPDENISNAITVTTRSKFGGEDGRTNNLFNLTRDNYFIGHRSGSSMTSGAQNCFFGFESGYNTTTGYGNIFFGESSGSQNLDGSFNTFIGYRTGTSNTTGFNNVFLGFAAGSENRTGVNNVYIGSDAGVEARGGSNVYIGTNSGGHTVWGHNNIFLGNNAGANADTSIANIYVGSEAGFNSIGEANVFIGNSSGENNHGHHNTFLGHMAGYKNWTGDFNTFLGTHSGQMNETGISNTFLGMGAGGLHVAGNENVFIGCDAGNEHNSGNANVFIGTRAGAHNTDGSDNIFIGFEAGQHEPGNGKLYIDLYSNPSDEALIYGEFYDRKVQINHQLGIGMMAGAYELEVSGEVAKTIAGDWSATSDARIKRNISDIENACEDIMKLRPVKFKYSDEWMQRNPVIVDQEYYNFIAQEFEEVFPQAVRKGGATLDGDNEELLQLDSYPAQVVAIKAIQELIRENQDQQEIIEQLLAENKELYKLHERILKLEIQLQD